jgi:2-polyprenyl-3-methyl-5-hydroxy-6-metoxy-1,4-benzoquinol methylase
MTVNHDASAMADRDIHDQWAATYRSPEAQPFYELAFDEIARRLDAPADSVILDAGCGSCAKSVLLAKRGFRVMGVDFSADALSLARTTLARHGVADRVTVRQGDLLNLPFADGEFAYILCWGVLMHVPDVERALSELARVLKPGGMLVTSEANMYSLQAVAMRSLKRLLRRGRGRVVRTPAGLVNHEQTDHGELVTRETDIAWYVATLDGLGLDLNARLSGQFTELYVIAPWKAVRRAIHAWNHFWFSAVGFARPAVANILIFRKRAR